MAIKALACELPAANGVPLARWHAPDLARAAIEQGIVASISDTTIWRWLSADAIRPWQYRSWTFPRDPDFALKAGRVLDLYHRRRLDGEPLGRGDFVVCADEKTSIQARLRKHATAPPAPRGRAMRIEHEYERGGALAYLAAWDVHRAKLFGRCEPSTGIEPFGRLVGQVMGTEPYASAERVFWIVDNGSSHRGRASIDRLQGAWSNLVLVHLAVHASWLRARSRSTSPSCSARCSPPTTSPTSSRWRPACSTSRTITRGSPDPSNGSSLVPTSTPCSQKSKGSIRLWPRQHDPKYVTVIPCQSTKARHICHVATCGSVLGCLECSRTKAAPGAMGKQALTDVDRAFDAFFKRRSRFPRLRSKKAGHFTFRIPQRVRVEDGRVYLPKVGWVRIRLSRGVEGTTKSATFKRDATGHWYVVLSTEFEIPEVEPPAPGQPGSG